MARGRRPLQIADITSTTVGRCIYCGADGKTTKLSKEHAIPYGLDGQYILKEASCQACAAATCSIESFCLRHMFFEARTHLRMATRNKKDRPTELPVYIAAGEEWETRLVPINDRPFGLRLPRLARPPYLTGKWCPGALVHIVGEDRNCFWDFFGAKDPEKAGQLGEVALDVTYDPRRFGLLLAKIAHCAAVFQCGYGTFEPFLARHIINKSEDVGVFVGGCAEPAHAIRTCSAHVWVHSDDDLITVKLSLFANLGAPYYEVVVGRPRAAWMSASAWSIHSMQQR